ncbi:MAG: 1-acyl-sn-glycerol-3-phosphate acyltransferase [Novosphingobium sp.]|nr:1-acyl-sn-glycerol-3-phosphate acyltransferase [Novosphingobium sp.]
MECASLATSDERVTEARQRRLDAARGLPTPVSPIGWTRLAMRVLLLALTLAILVPLHYAYRLIAYGSPFPRLFLAAATRIIGVRTAVVGKPLRRDVLFIANHVSWLDILAIAGASGTAFIAKAEVARTPVIGWLARLNRTVFVKREARLDIAAQIDALRKALADNAAIAVFPEGTTTDGHSLLPFKTSMLRVLEPPPPGVQVQPVFLDYGAMAEEIGWIGLESGLNNVRRILSRSGTFVLRLHFLAPFSPDEVGGRKAIAAEARRRIEAALCASLGQPPRAFSHDVEPVRYTAPVQSDGSGGV